MASARETELRAKCEPGPSPQGGPPVTGAAPGTGAAAGRRRGGEETKAGRDAKPPGAAHHGKAQRQRHTAVAARGSSRARRRQHLARPSQATAVAGARASDPQTAKPREARHGGRGGEQRPPVRATHCKRRNGAVSVGNGQGRGRGRRGRPEPWRREKRRGRGVSGRKRAAGQPRCGVAARAAP